MLRQRLRTFGFFCSDTTVPFWLLPSNSSFSRLPESFYTYFSFFGYAAETFRPHYLQSAPEFGTDSGARVGAIGAIPGVFAAVSAAIGAIPGVLAAASAASDAIGAMPGTFAAVSDAIGAVRGALAAVSDAIGAIPGAGTGSALDEKYVANLAAFFSRIAIKTSQDPEKDTSSKNNSTTRTTTTRTTTHYETYKNDQLLFRTTISPTK